MAQEVINYLYLFAAFISSLVISFTLSKALIKLEKKRSISHQIHRLIVKTHQKKKGTATLGGVAIYIALITTLFIYDFSFVSSLQGLGIILIVTAFFLIGLFDDIKKLREKNEEGLSPSLRIGLEWATSFLGLVILGYSQKTTWLLNLPFSEGYVYLSYLIPFLLTFVIVGTANASNLVDGLDGLNGGLMLFALTPFLVFGLVSHNFTFGILIIAGLGSILGFLLLNIHPAKIFMGDSGSLMLGALLATLSISSNHISELPIVGAVLVLECLSVIIQVLYYKATKKRVFKMAPFHHHLELCGKSESQIVSLYYVTGFIFMVFGILLGVHL